MGNKVVNNSFLLMPEEMNERAASALLDTFDCHVKL